MKDGTITSIFTAINCKKAQLLWFLGSDIKRAHLELNEPIKIDFS
jgi:hypothetical protein